MSDVFDRIAARAAGAPAARLTERRDVWSAEPAVGVPGGAAPRAGVPGGGRWPAPAREEGPTPATPEGRAAAGGRRASRPGGEGVATRAVGPGARPDGSASDLGAAGPSPSRWSGATVPDDVSAGPAPRARRGDPRRGASAVDGGAVAGRGGGGRGAVRPGASGPTQDRLEQGGPAPGRAGAGALGARPEGDERDAAPTDAAPTDAAPTVAGASDAAPTDAAPTDAAPQRALLPGLAGAASALRLRGPGPETPPGGVRDTGAPEGPAPAPRRDGSARTPRDPASAAIAPEDLLREHVAPALAGRGVLDLAAGDDLAAPGLGPVEAPAGAVVHVHVERVDVHRPAPDPPRAAREGARVDHADYLARQQRRWR
ncbi:hypothetical protein [Isoptericola sp. NPDC057653]|uniref:hypothetical protein n=1 Tax=Isoptericola sp. NPDC057653 TaxID=3346195 RepID=UPI003677B17B